MPLSPPPPLSAAVPLPHLPMGRMRKPRRSSRQYGRGQPPLTRQNDFRAKHPAPSASQLPFICQFEQFMPILSQTCFNFAHEGWNERSRSEEHTSELQSLMRISYAVFCLKKKNITNQKRQQ